MLNVTYNKPFMLSVIMLNVIMLNIIILNVIMLNVVMLNVVMLNIVMLDVILLNVVLLNVIMLCVMELSHYNEVIILSGNIRLGEHCLLLVTITSVKIAFVNIYLAKTPRTVFTE